MGQFDDTVDNAIGGTELSPSPQLDPIGQQAAPLPDVSPILSSMPGIPQPPPTPPPPVNLPLSPKQKLMALFATSFALGAGPHSGEAMGALQGLAAERQKEQQNAMLQWNVQRQQNDQQRKIVEQQQAELDRQRSLKLTQTFDNFRKDLQKVQETGTDEDYRKLVSMYSGALTASGFRVPPQYFYQNFKFTPPTEQQAIQKALTTYYADPLNKKLLETNPSQVEAGAITYKSTLNGQPVLKRLSIADARKALGVDNNVINGQPMFSTLGKGPEIQQDTARATAEIEAEIGRKIDPANKSDNNLLMARIGEFQRARSPKDPLLDTERQLNIQKLRRDLVQSSPEAAQSASFEFSPDKPKPEDTKTIDPRTGMSNSALYQNALAFALEGKSPSLGLGSRQQVVNARNAIQNKAAALAQAAGVSLPEVRAAYAANRGALAKLLPQQAAANAAANAAGDNLDLALTQSDQVARTGSRLANRYLQWAQGQLTPAKGLTQFEVYIYTAAREYAKVASGGALSAQGLTDSAAREAEKLLSASMSPEGLSGAVDAMKHDMANIMNRKTQELAKINTTIASFLSGEPVQQPQQDTPPPKTYLSNDPNAGRKPRGGTP